MNMSDLGDKAGDLSRWFKIEGGKRAAADSSLLKQADGFRPQVRTDNGLTAKVA
jgi:hypothetical protein